MPAAVETRIALFSPDLGVGGAERVLLNLAHGLKERGYAVEVVLVKPVGDLICELPDSVTVYVLGASRSIFGVPALARYLRKRRPTSLLAFQDHASMVAILANCLSGSPTRVFASVHTCWSKVLEHRPTKKNRLLKRLARLLYCRATGVIAVSKGVAADLARTVGCPRERITVIYNPVVTPVLYRKAAEPVAHAWFQEPVPVVIGIGRLTKEKDFATLIRAFAELSKTTVARLMIFGEGEQRRALEVLISSLRLEDRVILFGETDKVLAYMRRASVFVLSSVWEGLPTVLIEALALNVPIVSTDCQCGPREILKEGRYGRLVPIGDVFAMAGAIQDCLSTAARPNSAEAARRFVAETAVDAYERVLARQ